MYPVLASKSCFPIDIDEDGSSFTDHDGTHFPPILNSLRVSCVATLPDAITKVELAIEGDLYGLGDLVRALRMPIIDLSE